MPLDPKVTVAGLFTNGNQNSAVPPGSCSVADNVVVRANGQMEPRRGMPAETNTISGSTRMYSLGFYGGGRIASYTDGSSKLAYSTGAGAAWNVYSGTYSPVDIATLRMKFVEASQNLYFNTSVGLKVLSSLTSTPTTAGIPAPYDLVTSSGVNSGLSGNPSATGSWLAANSAVGYRVVIGIRDVNGNLKLSAPSGRRVITNPADSSSAIGGLSKDLVDTVTATTLTPHGLTQGDIVQFTGVGETEFGAGPHTVTTTPSSTTFTYTDATGATNPTLSTAVHTFTSGTKYTNLRISWEAGSVTTSNFVRLYRTAATAAASVDPGDEMFQMYERRLTAAEVSAGEIDPLLDKTPESSLYSSPLYTNPKTGDSIAAAADLAPLASDFCTWQERLWFGNTVSKQRYTLQILGIGSPDGIQTGDILVVAGMPIRFYDSGLGGVPTTDYSNVKVTSSLTPSKNIDISTESLVFNINGRNALGFVDIRITKISGVGDAPGRVMIETTVPSSTPFYIAATRTASFSPSPALASVILNTSARVGTTVTVNTSGSHGFTTGDQVYLCALTPLSDFPEGIKTIVVDSATQFHYTEAGAATSFNAKYVVHGLDQKSDNSARPNGIMYSKYQEPEAVPTANYFTVGAKNKDILRIVPLREKLFVFKEDGLYTVSGNPPYQSVDLLDASCILVAADSAVVLGGKIYALTNQGVVTVSEGGVQVISYPIERDLRALVATLGTAATLYSQAAAYESDRFYILCLMDGGTSSQTQYVYSYVTKAWTRWTVPTSFMAVDPTSDCITHCYSSGGSNKVAVELKTYAAIDYADVITAATISSVNTSTKTAVCNTSVTAGWSINGTAVATSSGTTFTYIGEDPGVGACSLIRGVPVTVTFARNAQGQPGLLKHFKEAMLHFGSSNVYKYTLTYVNEYPSSSSSIVLLSDVTNFSPDTSVVRNIRTLVPLELQRSTSLTFGFTMNEGLGFFQLDGHGLVIGEPTTRVNRQ